MGDPTKSVRCVRDWRDFSLAHFRLPSDGRQWRQQAKSRRELAFWIASFADGDGHNIKVGVERMSDYFEVDRATIFRWLDDLMKLRATTKAGRDGRYGTAVRSMTREAFVARYEAEQQLVMDSYPEWEASQKANGGSGVRPNASESQTQPSVSRKLSAQYVANSASESQTGAEFATLPSFDRTDRPFIPTIHTGDG